MPKWIIQQNFYFLCKAYHANIQPNLHVQRSTINMLLNLLFTNDKEKHLHERTLE